MERHARRRYGRTVLGPQDDLDPPPRRVLVAGTSGAGKTTAARRIARILDVPRTEIDGLYHGAGWEPRPTFVADVEAFTSAPAWVIEWQYTAVRPLLAERADTLVWLDLPVPVTLWRLTRRTVLRRLHRVELWNGNVEPGLRTVFTDPRHILRWGFRTRHSARELVPGLEARVPHLRIVRLRTPRDVDRWIRRLSRQHG